MSQDPLLHPHPHHRRRHHLRHLYLHAKLHLNTKKEVMQKDNHKNRKTNMSPIK